MVALDKCRVSQKRIVYLFFLSTVMDRFVYVLVLLFSYLRTMYQLHTYQEVDKGKKAELMEEEGELKRGKVGLESIHAEKVK